MALRAFSASCAASHEPFAAVASSRASKLTVTFGIFVSAIAIWIELTISTVCVRDAPVMGRLEMILTVLAADAPVVPPVPPPPHAPITSARAVMAAAAAVHRLCMQILLSGLIGLMARPRRAASLRRLQRHRASLASSAPCVNEDEGPPLYARRVRLRRATCLVAAVFIATACAGQVPQISRPTPLSTTPPDRAPAGLPTGRVLFSKGGIDLWSAAPDGSGRVSVTTDGAAAGGYLGARWSPDGTLIAAERALPGEGGSQLFVVRAGAAPVRISRQDTFLDGYAWSPDGG